MALREARRKDHLRHTPVRLREGAEEEARGDGRRLPLLVRMMRSERRVRVEGPVGGLRRGDGGHDDQRGAGRDDGVAACGAVAREGQEGARGGGARVA